MSNDEIERGLGDLELTPPRPEVRGSILDAVQTELVSSADGGRLDRLLSRPVPWAAAALLLLGLWGAHASLERNHAARRTELMGSVSPSLQTERARRLTQAEDQVVALLGEESRPLVRARLRGPGRAGVGARSMAERHAWLRSWMEGESS